MSIGALDAVRAYGRALGPSAASGGTEAPGTGGASFGDLVGSMVSEAGAAMRTAEAASARQVAGTADLVDVVTAIGAAETALDTMVAVRDRVVSAYQDIMRMQI